MKCTDCKAYCHGDDLDSTCMKSYRECPVDGGMKHHFCWVERLPGGACGPEGACYVKEGEKDAKQLDTQQK